MGKNTRDPGNSITRVSVIKGEWKIDTPEQKNLRHDLVYVTSYRIRS